MEELISVEDVIDRVSRELDEAIESGDSTLVRRIAAWKFRLTGYAFDEIAQMVGCSIGTAHADVHWAMKNLPSSVEGAEMLRRMSLERLEQTYRILGPARETADPTAIMVGLRIIDMQAKLMGAYAPTKIDADVKMRYEVVNTDTEAL